ncbi:MAG TPA: aminoglycoside phosphotransferase family protein [Actinospica sp.]|jgi:hypothetical protein|nr:aminoglycoside phosphotransferase family protein [Actinospica sp.]
MAESRSANAADAVTAEVRDFCREVLGDVEWTADRSWPHRQSVVLQMRDRRGGAWILKQFSRAEGFTKETAAYRRWVGALGPAAPTLVAAHEETRSIILTFEPGGVELERPADVHRRAGTLTRRFHGAEPAQPGDPLGDRVGDRLDRFLRDSGALVSEADGAFLRQAVSWLHELPGYDAVPVHLDNQPRNWLVDDAGNLCLIDFELAGRDVWLRDLIRLRHWDWARDPELEEAFCDGYGVRFSEDDLLVMDVLGAVSAATTVRWAREYGDAGFERRGRDTLALIRGRRG